MVSNSAIYKSVTGVLEQSIPGIGVEIREALQKDIEACDDRSMKKSTRGHGNYK